MCVCVCVCVCLFEVIFIVLYFMHAVRIKLSTPYKRSEAVCG